ncbi:cytidylate kinase-like family protein [Megasphaera vaginalis]
MNLIGSRDCVIIGRCGNYIFRDRKDCVRVFTCGSKEGRIAMKMKFWHLTREEAEDVVFHSDQNRKDYHKFHTGENWGEAKNYDLCIDALRLGHEKTARLIIDYISAVLPGSRP